jgi:hypothetical protein
MCNVQGLLVIDGSGIRLSSFEKEAMVASLQIISTQ